MMTLTPLKEHLACVAVMFRPLLSKDSDPYEIVTSFVRQFEERRRVQL
jgi:hypothetical protein